MYDHDGRLNGTISATDLTSRYQEARRRIEAGQRREAGQAGALVYAALAYGDSLERASIFGTVTHLSKLFCIAALFVIPNLLVIHVLL